MPLHRLEENTSSLITSSQIITSVSSVVKELVENALDAGSNNIEVKLEDNGLSRIEVKDDGSGISKLDVHHMCLSSYTSKIRDFSDLEHLECYGFRGEALNALCRVAEVTVTTKTDEDDYAMAYTMNKNGHVAFMKPSHLGKGTIVTANHLFLNIPVRRKQLHIPRRASEELRKVEVVVKSLAVIHPGLRVSLAHEKCLIWQKSAATTLKQSLLQALGHHALAKLEEHSFIHKNYQMMMMLPKSNLGVMLDICQPNVDCMMIYVNRRPVRHKKLEKLVVKHVSKYYGAQYPHHRYPTCLLSIETSPAELDINVEPNKTRVLLQNEDDLLNKLEEFLSSNYKIEEGESPCTKINLTSQNPKETAQSNNLQNQDTRDSKKLKLDPEASVSKLTSCKASSNTVALQLPDTQIVIDKDGEDINRRQKLKEELKAVHKKHLATAEERERKRTDFGETPANLDEFIKSYTEHWTQEKQFQACTRLTNIGRDPTNYHNDAGRCVPGSDADLVQTQCEGEGAMLNNTDIHVGRQNQCTGALNNNNNTNFVTETSVLNQVRDVGSIMNILSSDLKTETEQQSMGHLEKSVFNTSESIVRETSPSYQPNISLPFEVNDINMSSTQNEVENTLTKSLNKIETITRHQQGLMFPNEDLEKKYCLKGLLNDTEGESLVPMSDETSGVNDVDLFASQSTEKCPSEGGLDNIETGRIVGDLNSRDKPPPVSQSLWEAADLAMDNWSRGNVVTKTGQSVQGSYVLLPGVKNGTNLNTSVQSASSQMGRKEQSAFTKFSREMRPKILEENPGIAFTKVSVILVGRWRSMSAEQKAHYELLAAQEAEQKQKHRPNTTKVLVNKMGKKNCHLEVKIGVQDLWHKMSERKRSGDKIPQRRQVEVTVSLGNIKQRLLESFPHRGVQGVSLIGQLHPSRSWLYTKDNEVGLLRHWGLQESVLYHKMMTNHCVPLKTLDEKVVITERSLRADLWHLLLTLERKDDPAGNCVTITSPCIAMNGFRIEVKTSPEFVTFLLTAVASITRYYSLPELSEVLELIRTHGDQLDKLPLCRTLKVASYFRSEAVRITHQSPDIIDKDILVELLAVWETDLHSQGSTCVHDKPIFAPIYHLEDSDSLSSMGE
uniref:(California timema) hypothetical protein n=1 Tax=Timema californicum TaxID=61474 RepID=A0A7R9P8A5_TIMCA|nr:unnamed protein product [Timema californicum]